MNYLIVLLMAFTTIFLILGLITMAGGEKISKKFGTKLMTLRVVFQGLAILALLAAYFSSNR